MTGGKPTPKASKSPKGNAPKKRKRGTAKAGARGTAKAGARGATGKQAAKRSARRRAPSLHGKASRAKRPTKRDRVLALLRRPDGASIGALTEATGWQPHSVRAMLTTLRKQGVHIVRSKDTASGSRYRVVEGG